MASSPLSARSVAVVAGLSFAAGVAAGGADAHAATPPPAHHVHVCVDRARMVESPGGAVVGVVNDGDVVRILQRGEDDRWRRVLTTFRTRGWIRTAALCAGDR